MTKAEKLTLDELRVKVAEMCPAVFFLDSDNSTWWHAGVVPCDPITLDAMHEAEATLTPEDAWLYAKELEKLQGTAGGIGAGTVDQWAWHATAEQKARAFVATMEEKA